MKDVKIISPGDTLTLRIPTNTDAKIIEYINQERPIKRNKHMLNLLFNKIEEELQESGDSLTFKLPRYLTKEQRGKFQQAISTLISVMTVDFTEEEAEEEEVDLSIYNGLLELED